MHGRPAGEQFSLIDLEKAKVCLLDEWGFAREALHLPLQLLWLEGKPVPVCRPQNGTSDYGHGEYKGTAPISVTAPDTAVRNLGYLADSESTAGNLAAVQPRHNKNAKIPRVMDLTNPGAITASCAC